MIKHGMSHAIVVLVSIVAGESLSKTFLQYWPQAEHKVVGVVAEQLGHIGINWSLGTVTWLTTVVLFGFVWGMAFKMLHSDR